jgi:hypothetical protein
MSTPEKKLNPNASTFTFNPGASVFTPSFSPQPSPQNGARPSPAMKPSPALLATTTAPEFVPGVLSLGPAFTPNSTQEGAKQGGEEAGKKPTENGAQPSPSKALEAKRPAALTVADPSSAPADAEAPAEVKEIRIAGKLKVEVKGKRYSLRVMRLLQHDQKWTEMEPLPGLTAQIEEFKKLLEQSPELDPAKDMPDRKQADGGRGTPRAGGPGTPKGRGKKNAKDEPLRDKTGKIIEIKALEISESRWKPTKPTDDEEKVYKAVKGVLNKLTLEKFDKLYQELLVIGIKYADMCIYDFHPSYICVL